ncbi:hypothetical protein BG006_008053, partial [Podila minutissima]
MVSNIQYFYTQIMVEIQRLDKTGVTIQVKGKDRDQILDDVHKLNEGARMAAHVNMCENTLYNIDGDEDPAPRLFIVLPSVLDTWDDKDPSTHRFRLYFICDTRMRHKDDKTQHLHFSNHPGYSINQQQEFFQLYGDYILRVLQMIKQGYSSRLYEVPSLDTFKILSKCDSDTTGRALSAASIGDLVEKSITYLQILSPPTWFPRLALTRVQSTLITSYLSLKDGDNAKGNLWRHISDPQRTGIARYQALKDDVNAKRDLWRHTRDSQHVSWVCQDHILLRLFPGTLEGLKQFVSTHGGHVDMQLATLTVELGSEKESVLFCSLLEKTKHTFDISIKLNWNATRSQVTELCCGMGKTIVLEIDGINLDTHPQNYIHYSTNLFAEDIIPNSSL